jgi:hypothetical protein
VFGRHGPSIYADQAHGDEQYDAETQELILSSFDLLEHMSSKGEDFEQERIINHFFSGWEQDLPRAATAFKGMGYLVDMPDKNRLHVVDRAFVSIDWVEATIPRMCQTAGEFELNYDGWDCGPAIGQNQRPIILD